MAGQHPLDKLREHFTNQATPNAGTSATAAAEHGPHPPVSDRDDEIQAPDAGLPLVAERLDRIENTAVETLTNVLAHFSQVNERLVRIEQKQAEFLEVVVKGADEDRTHYTPAEFAEKAVKDGARKHLKDRTIRDRCNEGRIKATKRKSGRGTNGEWMIPREEYLRWVNEGYRACQ